MDVDELRTHLRWFDGDTIVMIDHDGRDEECEVVEKIDDYSIIIR